MNLDICDICGSHGNSARVVVVGSRADRRDITPKKLGVRGGYRERERNTMMKENQRVWVTVITDSDKLSESGPTPGPDTSPKYKYHN
jgi:hypothetical protein